jgi:hypothetical protein
LHRDAPNGEFGNPIGATLRGYARFRHFFVPIDWASSPFLIGVYTLGKPMILKLRSDYEKKLGSAYTLEKFHDALPAHGDPPLPLLRPILIGSFDDGKPL